jgi:hypothetical protein
VVTVTVSSPGRIDVLLLQVRACVGARAQRWPAKVKPGRPSRLRAGPIGVLHSRGGMRLGEGGGRWSAEGTRWPGCNRGLGPASQGSEYGSLSQSTGADP